MVQGVASGMSGMSLAEAARCRTAPLKLILSLADDASLTEKYAQE